MRSLRYCAAAVAIALLPSIASAQAQLLSTSQQGAIYNTEDYPHGALTGFSSIESGGFAYYPLLQFDLAAFAGSTVTGNGTFSFLLNDSWGSQPLYNQVNLRLVNTPWNEASVYYSGMGGAAMFGAILDNETAVFPGSPLWIQWTISQSVLQGWIDSPSTNYGITLENLGQQFSEFGDPLGNNVTGHADMYWLSDSEFPAMLAFNTESAPEPASLLLIATGMMGIAGLRVRRKRIA